MKPAFSKTNSFTDSEGGDFREELSKYYSLSGEVPENITKKVLAKIQLNNKDPKRSASVEYLNEVHEEDYQNERKAIAQMLHDTRITLQQRENISASILHGKYQITPEPSRSASYNSIQATEKDIVHTRDMFLDLNRHQLRKPHFLEVTTHRTHIPIVSPKEVYLEKMEHIRKTREAPKPMNFYPSMKQKQEGEAAHLTKESQNKLLADDKTKRINMARQQSLFNTEEALRLKKQEVEGVSKKVAVKKRLAEFRLKLKNHLEARNDPQTGQIMRCIDESMVYYFMEKYEGYSMSVEAILALIGNAVGTSMVAPDPAILSAERDIVGKEKRHVGKNKHAALTIEVVENTYTPQRSQPNSRQLNSVVFDMNPFEQKKSSRGHSKGLSDPVMGIAPRRYDTELRPLSPNRALGSGFRTESREGRPLEPIAKVGGKPQYFAVLGSDQVHNSLAAFKKEYFIDDSVQLSASQVASTQMPSTQLTSASQPALSGDDQSVMGAAAMRSQLIEEQSLPSMQPERVMTDEHLHELGTGIKSFEEIMLEMNPHYRFNNSKKAGTIVNKPNAALMHFKKGGSGSPAKEVVHPDESLSVVSEEIETKSINLGESRPMTPGTPKAPPKKALPLIGSVLSPSDRERFDQYTDAEINYFRHSIGPFAERPPPPNISLPQSPSGLHKPPKGIKTKTVYATRDGLEYLPLSPYKSFEEEMKVANTGIPAGAGLSLWRPHQKVTREGRYRAGQSSTLRDQANKRYLKPFVGM